MRRNTSHYSELHHFQTLHATGKKQYTPSPARSDSEAASMNTTSMTPSTTMQDVIDNPIYQRLQNVTLAKGTSVTREPDCPICLIAFEDVDYLLMDKTFGMSFHAECLLGWLTKKSSCPWCRQCFKTHNRAATQALIGSTNALVESRTRCTIASKTPSSRNLLTT